MRSKLFVFLLGLNLMLLLLHAVVPHYHYDGTESTVHEVVVSDNASYNFLGFLQHLFHTDVGADIMHQAFNSNTNLWLLLALMLPGLLLLLFDFSLIISSFIGVAPVVPHSTLPVQYNLSAWRQQRINLPPPALI